MAQTPETSRSQSTLWIILAVVLGFFVLCVCLVVGGLLFFNVVSRTVVTTPFPSIEAVTVPAPLATSTPAGTAAPPPAATLPPAEGNVSILTFVVEPSRIQAGECATLSWSVRNADEVFLLRDGEPIYTQAGLDDQFEDCLPQPGVYRYRLEAGNRTGSANFVELQVIVDE